jgi:hypothetical protein
MAEKIKNHETELPLTEEDLDERDSLFTIIANKLSKNINMPLFKEHIINYFNFIDNIDEMTADPDNFMSITQLEEQISLLIQKSSKLASQLATFKLSNIDEAGIILKKKEKYLNLGVNLKIHRSLPRTITTVHGKIPFSRTVLRPCTPADSALLSELGLSHNIFPFDEVTGLSKLPFKLSIEAMLEIAYRVQGSTSYEAAARILARDTGIKLDPDTVREVANHIGGLVFKNDTIEAKNIAILLNSGELQFPEKKISGVFYIETDGAMLHTREKDEQGSSWKENKLGMVFASDQFIYWHNKKGERVSTIGKREYITYIGDAETFKMHLFSLAIRNGYGKYEHTVLISDGATWIRNMKEELFPDAQQILDFFHLKENTSNFAKAIFEMDETKYKPWTEKVVALFMASKMDEAIEEIKTLGKRRIAKSKFNLLGYIQNNKNNIDYARYRTLGYYIGSGAIESGNRTVLQERLKRPGMRWNKETGQKILSLMSKAKSDMSRKGAATNGIWERDVVQAIRKEYEIKGFVKESNHII